MEKPSDLGGLAEQRFLRRGGADLNVAGRLADPLGADGSTRYTYTRSG